jgi:uncharacterized membrane-anchored protein
MDMTCIDSEEIKNRVEIVMRQTDYEKEVAEQKLKKHNYATACIKEYLGIEMKREHYHKVMSTNQRIYQQLRQQMGIVELPNAKEAQQCFQQYQKK